MDFQSLIGKNFSEIELYELLLFDIEANFEKYLSTFIHIYFERISAEKIKINEIVYFENDNDYYQTKRKIVNKKEWIEIDQDQDHINLMLCRFDRSGKLSSVRKEYTISQDMCRLAWLDEYPPVLSMTRGEVQEALKELCGAFQTHEELQNLESKKSA